MVDLGGSGTLDQVKQLVERKMASILNQHDYEQLPQSHRLRWENDMEWARFDLVAEGFVAANSPRGVWEITEVGRDWVEYMHTAIVARILVLRKLALDQQR